MRSPVTQNELRPLEGNPTTIWEDGQAFVTLAGTMSDTAELLVEIGDSSVHKSKGTDRLGDMAKDSSGDLADAAVRYEGTGKALRTYADALRVAQNWIDLHQADVERAERAYQDALDDKEAADREVAAVGHQWPWEDEPTQAEKDQASSAATTAGNVLQAAEIERDTQWQAFDQTFSVWSDAYDAAVDGVQGAMDAADNGDGFWGFVDDLLTVISVVLIVLTVVALIIGAPFTGLLAGVILGLTLLSLGLTALKWADGRATLTEVGLAALGLLPVRDRPRAIQRRACTRRSDLRRAGHCHRRHPGRLAARAPSAPLHLGNAVPVARRTHPLDEQPASTGGARQPAQEHRQRRPRGAADPEIPDHDGGFRVGVESGRSAVRQGHRAEPSWHLHAVPQRGQLDGGGRPHRLRGRHGTMVSRPYA